MTITVYSYNASSFLNYYSNMPSLMFLCYFLLRKISFTWMSSSFHVLAQILYPEECFFDHAT